MGKLKLDKSLDFRDFEDHSSPWSRVACIPKEGTNLLAASDRLIQRYPVGRIGLVFETARYYCQRVYRR